MSKPRSWMSLTRAARAWSYRGSRLDLQLLEVVGVRVPAAARLDGHESHTRLDQPASQQATLAQVVAAIALAQRQRLAGNVEGLLGLLVGHHLHRVFVEGVQPLDVARRVDVAADRVEVTQQLPPIVQTRSVHPARQLQIAYLEVVGVGIGVRSEWIVRRSEVRRLAQTEGPRQVDVSRQPRLVGPLHPCRDRSARGIDVVVDLDGRLIAGKHPLRSHAVAGVGVVGGAQDRQLVHHLGLVRQVLADLNAGDVGADRLELAANLRRGTGLQVVGVQMAGPAGLPDQDDGLAALGGSGSLAGAGLQAKQARQRQTAEGQAAHLQQGATR